MTEQPSIRSLLASLTAQTDDDAAFLVAATVNLYIESLRRVSQRVLLGGQDVRNILMICDLLLAEKGQEPMGSAGRSRELTNDEQGSLLASIEEKVGRRS